MKKKNGFVFVETIVVLTVTMVILLTLYNSYVVIIKNIQSREYFNNMNDIYKAQVVKRMCRDDSDKLKYSPLRTDRILVYVSATKYTNNNKELKCTDLMRKDCSEVLDTMGVNYVVIVPPGFNALDFTNLSQVKNGSLFYKMSFQKYLSTLDEKDKTKNIGHIIVITIDSKGKYHYGSVKA